MNLPLEYALPPRHWFIRYAHQPGALVGLGIGLVILLIAIFANIIAPTNPKVTVADALHAPSLAHWFGADDLGRDTFSNVIHGTRVALIVGLVTALTSTLIGTLVGLVSGYVGGWWDDLLMRVTETFQMLPRFFLALLLVSLFGSNIMWVALMLGLTFWTGPARLLRSQVLSIKNREFVIAARSIGAHELAIMFRHVLPNAFAPVVVSAARQIAGAILTEAGLSFLGLGDPTLVSWGQLLNNAQRFIRTAWWLFVFPGAALALTILSTTLIADGLVAALRPQTHE
ncbi:MAG: ABC transporter permease [Chloroflexi bacterium]|nr:ABC transporter permease [Chloroflexota bacterium]